MSAATSSISDSVDEEKLNDFKLYCAKFSFCAPDPNDPGFRRCQVQGCGSFFKWKPSNGYTTMGSHLVKNHDTRTVDTLRVRQIQLSAYLVLPRGSCPTVESIWDQKH